MSIRRLLLVLLPFFFLSCDQSESPLGPEVAEPHALLSIVDGSGPDGLSGFYFRPPIVPGPLVGDGEFDSSLLDLLAVEVCEWTGDACALPLIRRITSEDRPPEGLRMNKPAGLYRGLWDTRQDDLDPEKTYRVRVLASGGELGHADVDVVEEDDGMWDPHDADRVRLVKGEGLPIAFRIEEGLGERVGADDRTVVLAGGAVSLELPEGALGEGGPEVFLTASPAKDLPPGLPPIIPGTAWDFGPDGLVFDKPVWMTISYDPAGLPPGTDPNELRIHKFVDGDLVQMDAGLVDLVNHTVSALVEGFSLYVVIEREYPGSPEDVTPPVIHSMTVLDETAGTFGSATTLELSSGDAILRSRLKITDDISGVGRIDLWYVSASGQQTRLDCYYDTGAPISGSDTNGEWDCTGAWPQYSEAAVWKPDILQIRDRVGNYSYFGWMEPDGFCDYYASEPTCYPDVPQVTVSSDPSDTEPPWVHSLQVSLGEGPRSFGSSVTVDASTRDHPLVFGFQATDDLAGVGRGPAIDWFYVVLAGPGGQSQQTYSCSLTAGTTMDGFWECHITLPQHAEVGTWRVNRLKVPDRVGNGGWFGGLDFVPDGSGQLCNPRGNCVDAPTVEVTSLGDSEPPSLSWVGFQVQETTVTITLALTDNLSGARTVRPSFRSASTTQFHECFGALTSGSPTDGLWVCSFTFPEFSARGDWYMYLSLYDAAGNYRYYYRRAEDGFLCYNDGGGQHCQNVGPTDIVLE